MAAKPPFEPAPGPVHNQSDKKSGLRGPVITDVAVNAQASALPADTAQIAPQPKTTKIAEPAGDLGMWPFEALKNVAQSTAR